jgi:hypothetical protein
VDPPELRLGDSCPRSMIVAAVPAGGMIVPGLRSSDSIRPATDARIESSAMFASI